MYSAVYHALNLLSFNLHRHHSNQYQHHFTDQKREAQTPAHSPWIEVLQPLQPTRRFLLNSKPFLIIRTQNVLLSPCNAVSSCFRSHLKQYLLLPTLKQQAPTTPSFLHKHKMICIPSSCVKDRNTLTFHCCILSAQHRR